MCYGNVNNLNTASIKPLRKNRTHTTSQNINATSYSQST